jgi:NitT/TauT family transport system permease protein
VVSSVVDEVSKAQEPVIGFRAGSAARSLVGGLAAAAVWFGLAALTVFWPDKPESDWAYTGDFAALCGALAIALVSATIAGIRFARMQRVRRFVPWLLALAFFLAA